MTPTASVATARRPRRGSALPLVAAAVLAAGTACAGPGRGDAPDRPLNRTGGDPGPGLQLEAAPDWPYWPRAMRIHPLTRIVLAGDGSAVLELRVEFLDRDGHGTKACGRTEMALFLEAGAGAGAAPDATPGGVDPTNEFEVLGDPGAAETADGWDSDLTDPEEHAARFDRLTRTYLYKLAISPDVLNRGPRIFVRHDSLDGRQFVEGRRLRTDPIVESRPPSDSNEGTG